MEKIDIYKNIALRSNGDIYFGVVGPVRTGKSTFISKFMDTLVLPNMVDNYAKKRAIDELPQSAQGKTIMTTQPLFVPNEAVKIKVNEVQMNIRLVDCVGYLISGALGSEENQAPRLVKTPWTDKQIPFEMAAEMGTNKVISEHATVGVMVTTDGSFTDIERENYVEAEEKVVEQLKLSKKPFVIILNTLNPTSEDTHTLATSLESKYQTKVLAMNVLELDENKVSTILESLLLEFPIVSVDVKMPSWLNALDFDNPIIQEIATELNEALSNTNSMGDFKLSKIMFENSEYFIPLTDFEIVMGEGKIRLFVKPKDDLFYKVISQKCDIAIQNEYDLISYLNELTVAKKYYDKIKDALEDVEENGYGVVFPLFEDMQLEDPTIVKQGSRYGVQLRASAPSYHMIRVDINAEINPLVGSQQQSEDLVKYLMSEFESNPQGIWQTNMFGKSLNMLMQESLNGKLVAMPVEAQKKMRKTLSKIVNEGKGGIICILL